MRDMDDDLKEDIEDTPTHTDIVRSSIREYVKRIPSFLHPFVDIIGTVGKMLIFAITVMVLIIMVNLVITAVFAYVPDEIYAEVTAGATVLMVAFSVYGIVDVFQLDDREFVIGSVALGFYNFILCLQFASLYFSSAVPDAPDLFQGISAAFGALGGFFSVLIAYLDYRTSIQ